MRIFALILFISLFISACTSTKEVTKELSFSKKDWFIKQHGYVHGPGKNLWDSTSIVQDEKGIHFSIDSTSKGIVCSEIISKDHNYGYGVYEIQINGRFDSLANNTVFGIFLYQKKRKSPGEIDVEFTKWNKLNSNNTHYTIHNLSSKSPLSTSQSYNLKGNYTTHIIKWTPDSLSFGLFHGHVSYNKTMDEKLQTLKSDQKTTPFNYRFHINFWKLPNTLPKTEKQKIIVSKFKYTKKL
tara:strand:+ start:2865 stop:3584 length:720 start_codon:yes stop_codon:yes gene_type:complete